LLLVGFVLSWLEIDYSPFTRLSSSLGLLFAFEVAFRQMGKDGIWSAVSRSVTDKIVFVAGLILFFVFVTIPVYLSVTRWWISLTEIILSIMMIFFFLKRFGSKTQ
jgi:hypothetical protein